jgi:AcrR family transcriptional regulator
MTDDLATKEKILAATVALLKEEENPDRITVRQIAERAGVAVGAINYHFQSKDSLVNRAIRQMITDAATPWYESARRDDSDPATQLRQLTKDGVTAAFRYHKMSTHSLIYWVLNSEFEVETQILPLLREIYGQRKGETELRLLAFELVTTIQVAVLRRDAFRRFVGIDLKSAAEREAMLDTLISHLLETPEANHSSPPGPSASTS